MREKLFQLGFEDSAVIWFDGYLTNRTQSITINGVVSDPQFIQYGVPQGSILGPLLFIIYINDLPSVIQNCSIQLYADDTLLFFSSNSVTLIESTLSGDLNRIISWLNRNFLFLNHSKTKIMLIGTHQRLAKVDSFNIEAQDTKLDRVTNSNISVLCLIHAFLGMITLIIFLLRFHLGLACYVRLERLFRGRHVSHYMML